MANRLRTLQDRRAALIKGNEAILAATEESPDSPDASGGASTAVFREMTDDEKTIYAANEKELVGVIERIGIEEKHQAAQANLTPIKVGDHGRADEGSTHITVTSAAKDDPKRGFKSSRDFLLSVLDAGTKGFVDDERLRPLATAGSDEAGGYADPVGGYLLPSSFSPNLLSLAAEEDPLAGLTTSVPMETAVVEIPARVDKNHSSSVSGGLRVYRRAETDTVTPSKMAFEQVTLQANNLFGAAFATEELLARSPISFVALLEAGFRDEFASKLTDERLNGTGVGMFEGVLTSPCLIAQPKETGQVADTIVYENVINIRSRCWRYSQAIWLANHDTLPQLMKMTIDVGTGGLPVWQPSAREDAPDLLLGRPIFFTESCETVGDQGDILLGVWSQYLEGLLTPSQSADSIHVRFLNHERTFKFWLENDGRCWWRSALTPKNSTTTLSPFVTLEAR